MCRENAFNFLSQFFAGANTTIPGTNIRDMALPRLPLVGSTPCQGDPLHHCQQSKFLISTFYHPPEMRTKFASKPAWPRTRKQNPHTTRQFFLASFLLCKIKSNFFLGGVILLINILTCTSGYGKTYAFTCVPSSLL